MPFEIRHNPGPAAAGRTYWAELYDVSKNVWDNSTGTFRDESLVTPAHRAIALADNAGVGKYWGDLPEVPAGIGYQWFVRRQVGGTPSMINDTIDLVGEVFDFDGARVGRPANVVMLNGASAATREDVQQGGTVAKDSTDPVKFTLSAAGLSVSSKQLAKPGGAFATAAGTVADRGSGTYEYAPTTAETDTRGNASLRVVATSGEAVTVNFAITAASGGGGTGSGDTAITQDGAAGVTVGGVAAAADCMRFTVSGVGADGVEVVAYLKGDYDAGLTGTGARRGTTVTDDDGRWVEPLMLSSGTYKICANKDGFQVDAFDVVVP